MSATPRILGGRYEVGELVGRGGMADVHAGHDTRLGRPVAIKILRSDLARDPSFLQRFRREAQAALGDDFLRLLDEGPVEALNLTVNTQPAMVAYLERVVDAATRLGGGQRALAYVRESLGGLRATADPTMMSGPTSTGSLETTSVVIDARPSGASAGTVTSTVNAPSSSASTRVSTTG